MRLVARGECLEFLIFVKVLSTEDWFPIGGMFMPLVKVHNLFSSLKTLVIDFSSHHPEKIPSFFDACCIY